MAEGEAGEVLVEDHVVTVDLELLLGRLGTEAVRKAGHAGPLPA